MYSGIDHAEQIEGPGAELEFGEYENGITVTPSEEFVDIHVASQSVNGSLNEGVSQDAEPSEDLTAQLRQRIRYLEGHVQSQNAALLDKERLNRNYKATLEELLKVETEKRIIEGDREKFFKEKMFLQHQAEEYMRKNDTYKERLENSNRQLLSLRNETDKKIKCLEKAVLFWRGKYENARDGSKDKGSMDSKTLKACPEDGNLRPVTKRNIATFTQPKRRRHTFHQSRTVLPTCRNCSTVFDRLEPHEVQCRFHRSPPQPWKTWMKQLCGEKQFDHANTQGYMYWPCCEQIGLKEPPGCLKLKDHDLSSLDEA